MIEIEGIVGYVSAYYKLLSFVDAKEALSFAQKWIDDGKADRFSQT